VGDGELVLHDFVDSDWTGDVGDVKYFMLMFQFGFRYNVLVEQEAGSDGTQFDRGKVYGTKFC